MGNEKKDNFNRFQRFSSVTDTIAKNLQKYKNDKLSQFGLKSMHLMFLCSLDKAEGGMTLVELAKSCGVDKAFISRITRELCLRGYVNYAEDKSFCPKYKKRLVLTENGRKIMKKINEMIDEAVAKITEGIPEDKIDVFYQVLRNLDLNLSVLCEEN